MIFAVYVAYEEFCVMFSLLIISIIFGSGFQLDRFIPNRSAMDFDYAHYMLTEGKKGKENPSVNSSPSREAYSKQLAETFNMNRTRILAFKNKPPTLVEDIPNNFAVAAQQPKSAKPRRHIPQVGAILHIESCSEVMFTFVDCLDLTIFDVVNDELDMFVADF